MDIYIYMYIYISICVYIYAFVYIYISMGIPISIEISVHPKEFRYKFATFRKHGLLCDLPHSWYNTAICVGAWLGKMCSNLSGWAQDQVHPW